MTALSTRKVVALGGLVLLVVTVQVAVSMRRGDWSEMLESEGWLWALIPAAFMGVWGWITLWFSRQSASHIASKSLIALALLYFMVMAWLTFDIVLNGNSTSGIAFFFLPGLATLVMLPLIVLITWIGWKVEGGSFE